MRGLVPMFAVLIATTVTGCSGGDNASAAGGPFTIVAHLAPIDFTAGEPDHGTFRVTRGSEELGCSRGTFVDQPLGTVGLETGQSSGVTLKVYTCAEGDRSGSFLIRLKDVPSSRWKFRSGTRDFAGVKGKGKFLHLRSKCCVETLTGLVRFS